MASWSSCSSSPCLSSCSTSWDFYKGENKMEKKLTKQPRQMKTIMTWRRVSWTRSETFLPASQLRGPNPCTWFKIFLRNNEDNLRVEKSNVKQFVLYEEDDLATSIFPPSTFSSWSSNNLRFPSISAPIAWNGLYITVTWQVFIWQTKICAYRILP